uniref:Uncharacterized protein n=1 Tax=Rhizophora mucronata TaxID=61149 RepID=A0A2P2NTC2_RHIMU
MVTTKLVISFKM